MGYYEKLVQYYENTPKEEIDRQWEETKEYDAIGPTVEEFLKTLDDAEERITKKL